MEESEEKWVWETRTKAMYATFTSLEVRTPGWNATSTALGQTAPNLPVKMIASTTVPPTGTSRVSVLMYHDACLLYTSPSPRD